MRQTADTSLVTHARMAAATVVTALLFCAGVLAMGAPAWAETEAWVKAQNERGYGRLVLTFDELPQYGHDLAAGVLVLSFEEPVNVDLGEIADTVPDYVVVARRDPDGRALRLALSRSFRVNLMEAGNQIFIDLLPPEWTGAPPSLPLDVVRELARKAAEAEEKAREEARQRAAATTPYKLDIRLAQQPTFTRIVFDWNQFVTVNLARKASLVTFTFGAKAPVDLTRLKLNAPAFVRRARVLERDEGMAIELWIDDDVDLRGFREGMDYMVDLTSPEASANAAVAAATRAAASTREEGAGTDEAESLALPSSGGELSDVVPETQTVAEQATDTTDSLDIDALGEDETRKTESAASVDDAASDAQLAHASPDIPAALPKAAAAVSADKPVALPASASTDDLAVEIVGTVRVEGSEQNLKLVFPFAEPVASAIFRRGNVIWIALESELELDATALQSADTEMIAGVDHRRIDGMQVFRIKLSQPWLAYTEQTSNAWIVSIGNMVTGQSEALQLVRALRPDQRSLLKVVMQRPGKVHWLSDSEVGDQLAIVTSYGPAQNVAKEQNFVEFDALATAHGVAIRPKTDDVAVRLTLDELVITRREGLTLSAGNAGQYVAGKKALAMTGRPGFLDLKAWREEDPRQLTAWLNKLQAEIAMASDADRPRRRYELARTYLANGLTPEALGVLRQMAFDDRAVEGDPAFNALRGAALALLGRSAQAYKDLSVHALAYDPHSALWRGMAAAKERAWRQALAAFDEGSDVIAAYPADIQARFRLLAVRSALEVDNPERMAAELDAIGEEVLPKALAAQRQLLQARYFDRVGRVDEALQAYARVIDGDHEISEAEARLTRISLALRTGRMARSEAIEALERLQLTWRGDEVELGTMRLLADLYVEEERYRDAFEMMKTALWVFPEEKIALQIQDNMKLVFQDLFLHGKSEKLRPVDALGLYYGFRDMTPVGRLGDDMIRKLADRLIAVDLLDQAAGLLTHQVEKHLSGAGRAQIAIKLAMVHLMNRKPGLALRTIRQTRQAGLPQSLQESRNLLEARALGELGRVDAAIEILNTLEGSEIEHVKADVLWLGQQWRRAGEQLEKVLGMRWQEPGALSDQERFDVLRAGVSYSLASDQFALDRLRKKFYDKMVQSEDAKAFALVTRPIKPDGGALLKVARDIAAIDTLDAFMKSFRERFEASAEPPKKAAQENAGGAG